MNRMESAKFIDFEKISNNFDENTSNINEYRNLVNSITEKKKASFACVVFFELIAEY